MVPDQSLYLYLYLCLPCHLHGIGLHHGHVPAGLVDPDGRSDETNRSCHPVPFVRGGAPRQQLWKATYTVSTVSNVP